MWTRSSTTILVMSTFICAAVNGILSLSSLLNLPSFLKPSLCICSKRLSSPCFLYQNPPKSLSEPTAIATSSVPYLLRCSRRSCITHVNSAQRTSPKPLGTHYARGYHFPSEAKHHPPSVNSDANGNSSTNVAHSSHLDVVSLSSNLDEPDNLSSVIDNSYGQFFEHTSNDTNPHQTRIHAQSSTGNPLTDLLSLPYQDTLNIFKWYRSLELAHVAHLRPPVLHLAAELDNILLTKGILTADMTPEILFGHLRDCWPPEAAKNESEGKLDGLFNPEWCGNVRTALYGNNPYPIPLVWADKDIRDSNNAESSNTTDNGSCKSRSNTTYESPMVRMRRQFMIERNVWRRTQEEISELLRDLHKVGKMSDSTTLKQQWCNWLPDMAKEIRFMQKQQKLFRDRSTTSNSSSSANNWANDGSIVAFSKANGGFIPLDMDPTLLAIITARTIMQAVFVPSGNSSATGKASGFSSPNCPDFYSALDQDNEEGAMGEEAGETNRCLYAVVTPLAISIGDAVNFEYNADIIEKKLKAQSNYLLELPRETSNSSACDAADVTPSPTVDVRNHEGSNNRPKKHKKKELKSEEYILWDHSKKNKRHLENQVNKHIRNTKINDNGNIVGRPEATTWEKSLRVTIGATLLNVLLNNAFLEVDFETAKAELAQEYKETVLESRAIQRAKAKKGILPSSTAVTEEGFDHTGAISNSKVKCSDNAAINEKDHHDDFLDDVDLVSESAASGIHGIIDDSSSTSKDADINVPELVVTDHPFGKTYDISMSEATEDDKITARKGTKTKQATNHKNLNNLISTENLGDENNGGNGFGSSGIGGENSTLHLNKFINPQMLSQQTKVCAYLSRGNREKVEIHAFRHRCIYQKRRQIGIIEMRKCGSKMLVENTGKYIPCLTKHQPMLCEPIPWTAFYNGGFLMLRSRFIRWSGSSRVLSNMRTVDMTHIFNVVSQIGSVPWRINRDILKVMTEAYHRNMSIGNLPLKYDLPMPKTSDYVMTSTADVEKYEIDKHEVKRLNNQLLSSRPTFLLKLNAAINFQYVDTLYFPHNMDFRGRLYPLPPHLHHMSDDICRALLLFSRTQKLGKDGLFWLKIHLANLFGQDKLSFDNRIQWVDERMDLIIRSAQEPLLKENIDFWGNADDPWQSLAVIMDLNNAVKCDDPSEYESSITVHQDGSCNGLQHYAALGRDSKGAFAVNLIPSDKPQDVYTLVLDVVKEKVRNDVQNENMTQRPTALLCIEHDVLKRKVIKQTVMTICYGVTVLGARQQVLSQLQDLIGKKVDRKTLRVMANYLASTVLSSIGEVFKPAMEIKNWFDTVSRTCNSIGVPVCWMTPFKLPCEQPYRSLESHSVSTPIQTIRLSVKADHCPTQKIKQKMAFPPNFIHAMDATHMMLTAQQCLQHDKIDFAAVHDSYWTHAGTVSIMNKRIREQFINLYRPPNLGNFYKSVKKRLGALGDRITPPPPIGDLDIERGSMVRAGYCELITVLMLHNLRKRQYASSPRYRLSSLIRPKRFTDSELPDSFDTFLHVNVFNGLNLKRNMFTQYGHAYRSLKIRNRFLYANYQFRSINRALSSSNSQIP